MFFPFLMFTKKHNNATLSSAEMRAKNRKRHVDMAIDSGIVDYVTKHPYCTKQEVMKALNLAPQEYCKYLFLAETSGLIHRDEEGRLF